MLLPLLLHVPAVGAPLVVVELTLTVPVLDGVELVLLVTTPSVVTTVLLYELVTSSTESMLTLVLVVLFCC